MEKLKERLVMEIGNADDLSASLKLYTSFYPLIPEYKFVFSSPKGPYRVFKLTRNSSMGRLSALYSMMKMFS